MVGNLCVDRFGNLMQTCDRDGENENYLAPRDHSVGVVHIGARSRRAQSCAWTFDDGSGPLAPDRARRAKRKSKCACAPAHATVATVDIPLGDGTAQRVTTEINVRDVLIAGLGDSIAAGEGDPDQAVQLEGGFCFRAVFGGGQYFRPGRAGYTDDRSCENGPSNDGRGEGLGAPRRALDEPGAVTARSTAISSAPRWRSPSSNRTSP